jgi:hypothetical protein
MKSTASDGIHQYYPHHDHLCHSTTHLDEEELELQDDMNTARAKAKIGTAANMHYVCSAHQGTLNFIIGSLPDSLVL